jgi:hypothetical protein
LKDENDKVTQELPQMVEMGRREGQTFVPVSMVAKAWKVTSRRIRNLLAEGRLQGRQQDNGYWEVLYTEGTRGPALKRHRPAAPPLHLVPKNPEQRAE